MLTILDCQQGKCNWCLEETEVVQAKFQDGFAGLLCKKPLWQASELRCDAQAQRTSEEVRREQLD